MKRYIKSSLTEVDYKLPRLDQAIEDSKNDDMFSRCDFKYRVEYDGASDSYLLWLADYNEYIGSSEFYEYSFVYKLFKRFETAVQRDTGDKDFMFEPYDSVEFSGVFWVD